MDSEPIDETALVLRAKADRAVFGVLYETHYSAILNFLYRRTLIVAVAEELTSNTFLKALRGLKDFRPREGIRFRAWLYQIAINEVRMYWRDQSRRRTIPLRVDDNDLPRVTFVWPAMESQETEGESRQRFETVHRAIARLSEPDQTVLTLRYFEKLSHDEIATILGKKVATVRSLVHRALSKVAALIEQIDATF